MTEAAIPLVVTGATGRIGVLLRRAWAVPPKAVVPLWAGRGDDVTLRFDPDSGVCDPWPAGAVVLHLAGPTAGGSGEMAVHPRLAKAVARMARDGGAAHVLMASTIAVYGPGAQDHHERQTPRPASPYGAAKLEAEQVLAALGDRATALRIGNVAGADALLGGRGPVTLDPVPGRPGGPERSYIGPRALADVIADLARAARGGLPAVVNLALPGGVMMADLLTAAGRDWCYGPARAGVLARAVMDVGCLARLVPLPPGGAGAVVADLGGLS